MNGKKFFVNLVLLSFFLSSYTLASESNNNDTRRIHTSGNGRKNVPLEDLTDLEVRELLYDLLTYKKTHEGRLGALEKSPKDQHASLAERISALEDRDKEAQDRLEKSQSGGTVKINIGYGGRQGVALKDLSNMEGRIVLYELLIAGERQGKLIAGLQQQEKSAAAELKSTQAELKTVKLLAGGSFGLTCLFAFSYVEQEDVYWVEKNIAHSAQWVHNYVPSSQSLIPVVAVGATCCGINAAVNNKRLTPKQGLSLGGLTAACGLLGFKRIVSPVTYAYNHAPSATSLIPVVVAGATCYGVDAVAQSPRLSERTKKIGSVVCTVAGLGMLGLTAKSIKQGTYDKGTNAKLALAGATGIFSGWSLWNANFSPRKKYVWED